MITPHASRPLTPPRRLYLLLALSCAAHALVLAGLIPRPFEAREVSPQALHVALVSAPAAAPGPAAEAEYEPEEPIAVRAAPSPPAQAAVPRPAPLREPLPVEPAATPARPVAQAAPASERLVASAEAQPRASERPPVATPPSAALEEAYKSALRREIAAHRHYPTLARRLGQEGRVEVGFEVLADGRLRNVRIVASSGHGRLDAAAVETVERLGRFRPLPAEIQRERWPLVVPLDFHLL